MADEDTVLKALQNLTSTENLLFYGNEKGDLVVTEKASSQLMML